MAKANWITTNPSSGSLDGDVDVSSSTNTGRDARNSVITFKAANVEDAPCDVIQAGKPAFVDIADSASADKGGKIVTITGVSNAKKLTFTLGTGNLTSISLPNTYLANSLETANGANISGDPGATSEYNFSISIDVPANDDTVSLSRQIIVTDESGNQDVCNLTLAAGEPYIRISVSEIRLDYLGTPVTIHVESNTTWTVE